jgi:hypothetical protein
MMLTETSAHNCNSYYPPSHLSLLEVQFLFMLNFYLAIIITTLLSPEDQKIFNLITLELQR